VRVSGSRRRCARPARPWASEDIPGIQPPGFREKRYTSSETSSDAPGLGVARGVGLRRALMQVEQLPEADEGVLRRRVVDQAAGQCPPQRPEPAHAPGRRVAVCEQIALPGAQRGARAALRQQGEVLHAAEIERLHERRGGLGRHPRDRVTGRLPLTEERIGRRRAAVQRALAEALQADLDAPGPLPRLPGL
jgi:hypothetical protein